MKLLLDIDGVMILAKPWQSYQLDIDGFGVFHKIAVANLNKLIASNKDIEIILTTSHKHSFTIRQWENIFLNRGILPVQISKLNSNSLLMSRHEEINIWYQNNPNEMFIVIDDDKSLNSMDLKFKQNHLILTSPLVGLNEIATEEARSKMESQIETVTA